MSFHSSKPLSTVILSLFTSQISQAITVILELIADSWESSKRLIQNASVASWRAKIALTFHLRSLPMVAHSAPISQQMWAKGKNGNSNLRDLWYFLISRSATVPGLNLWGILPLASALADLLSLTAFIFFPVDPAAVTGTFPALSLISAICFLVPAVRTEWFYLS